jgi:glycosidase
MTAINQDKLIIYQIFTRLYSNQNTKNKFYGTIAENGCGKFNDFTHHVLSEIKKMGISHVWYTGILEHATLTDYTHYGIRKDHPFVVKGIAGSPYAVKDYYDVDPDLAEDVPNRMFEFEQLLLRTHTQDLKVLIDFIPNHVSRQYYSDVSPAGITNFGENDDQTVPFHADNNFYYIPNQDFVVPEGHMPPVLVTEGYFERPAKATGNDVFSAQPSKYDWYETIKLNYGVDYLNHGNTHFDPIPATWKMMYDILAFWAAKGVDGFRCDMAEMVPVAFWAWVIPKIKTLNPEIIFIAEIYNPQLYHSFIHEGKFDYLYDKVGLYNSLRELVEGHGSTENITRIWQQESGDISKNMLRFLENHDEQRIASEFFAKDPWKALPAVVLSATLHTGPFMLYFGQEIGVNAIEAEGFQGADGRSTIFDYWGIPEMQGLINQGTYDGGGLSEAQQKLRTVYIKLNHLLKDNEAIHSGEFYDLQYVHIHGQSPEYDKTRNFSFLRYTANQRLLLVFNFDLQRDIHTSIKIPEPVWFENLQLGSPENYEIVPLFTTDCNIVRSSTQNITTTGVPLYLKACSATVFELV